MDCFLPGGMEILQDDRIHWAQIVKEWFRKHETSFTYMDQPPQSPESPALNPIESIWNVLDKACAIVRLDHHQCKILVKKIK